VTSRIIELLDRRLQVRSDMNLDGVVSVSDVGLWLEWFYFLPGDLAALALLDTPVGDFLEITLGSMHGWGSAVLSFCVWFVVLEALLCEKKS
jgi:hypothetical protein